MLTPKELAINILSHYDEKHFSLKHAFHHEMSKYLSIPLEHRKSSFHYSIEVIRRLNTIDFILRKVVPTPLKDLPSRYKNLLRLVVYELKYESNINRKKVISETLSIVEKIEKNKQLVMSTPEIVKKILHFNLRRYTKKLTPVQKMALIYSHPVWFIKKVTRFFDNNQLTTLLSTNNLPRMTWLRANTLKGTLPEILEMLKREEIVVEQDPNYPIILKVIKNKIPLPLSTTVKQGYVFIQDKASVLTIYALAPRPGEMIWDACAAPSMKTITISQFMNNKGLIIATDYSIKRLKVSLENVSLAGAKNIRFIAANTKKISFSHSFDKVIIDAPCSSSGVFQSDPEFKWRVTLKKLHTLVATQRKIMKGVLDNLESGTIVVYVTCSILPDEGEDQILWLTSNYDIELIPLDIEGMPGHSTYWFSNLVKRTYPYINNTKGFFIAKFVFFGKKIN